MLLSLATCFYFVHHKPPVTGKTAVKTKSRMVARGSEITPSSTSQIWWSSILHQSPARLAKPCKITGPWFYFYCHALAKTLKGFGRCNTHTYAHTHTHKILCALLVHHSSVCNTVVTLFMQFTQRKYLFSHINIKENEMNILPAFPQWIKLPSTCVTLIWLVWFNSFNAELSLKRYWQGRRA